MEFFIVNETFTDVRSLTGFFIIIHDNEYAAHHLMVETAMTLQLPFIPLIYFLEI